MADEPKPKIDMKEESAKTKEVVETPKKQPTTQTLPQQKKDNQLTDKKISEPTGEAKEEKKEHKKPIQKKPVVKKTEAIVNSKNLPISTKYSIAICKFIKNKKIGKAISDLEQVISFKKAVPIKGEIPHRKGKGMMSGRYPKKASEHFIKLLKSLSANSNANGLENPMIVEAVANFASRPFGRFGRIRKKRSHVKIKVKEKKLISKK